MVGNENGRYKEFRNYLQNTLQITKGDIIEWTENATEAIVQRSIETGKINLQEALDRAMHRVIRSLLRADEAYYADDLRKKIVEQAAKQIKIELR